MSNFKYAIPLFIYQMWGYDCYSDNVLSSIAGEGYDAVEVPGATLQIEDPQALRVRIESHGLKVSAVTGLWGWAGGELGAVAEKDMMSSNSQWRSNAVQYIKDCIGLMAALKCRCMNVSPGPLAKCDTSPSGIAEARENLLQTMRDILPYAREKGVLPLLEPNNRYEGYPFFMNTIREAKEIIRELGDEDATGIVADTFHMNIEESSLLDALYDGGALIKHIHLLDNNRIGVGMGNIDFKPVFRALKRIGYEGYLNVESCPPRYDPKYIAATAIRNMRELERMVA